MLVISNNKAIIQHKGFYSPQINQEQLDRRKKQLSRSFILIGPNNQEIKCQDIKSFCFENKLSKYKFYQLINGKIKEYKGFKLKTRICI